MIAVEPQLEEYLQSLTTSYEEVFHSLQSSHDVSCQESEKDVNREASAPVLEGDSPNCTMSGPDIPDVLSDTDDTDDTDEYVPDSNSESDAESDVFQYYAKKVSCDLTVWPLLRPGC